MEEEAPDGSKALALEEDEMRRIYAHNAGLTPQLVFAMQVPDAKIAVCHPAQMLAWHGIAVNANAIEFETDKFPDIRETKLTLAGYPITTDNDLPESTIELRDKDGVCVSRIEGLAIPMAYRGVA